MNDFAVPIVRGIIHGYPRHNLGHLRIAHDGVTHRPIVAMRMAYNIREVRDFVGSAYGISPAAMVGKQRPEMVAWPRQIAMTLAYELTGAGLADIGREFGGRDHGTVMYAQKRVANRMKTEPAVRQQVEALKEQLRARVGV